jgi:lipoprotein-anchoring transpeptidase ErfK/SrfK
MRISKFIRLLVIALVALPAALAASTGTADALDTSATGRRIVVDISQQKVYAYNGNTLVFSTWANVRGTRRGVFRIQSKYGVARSYVLGWRLPHWMGIYYAGGLENGFHGPAYTARGGRAMTSLGCIVMPANAAATLYRWARIGTKVIVQS